MGWGRGNCRRGQWGVIAWPGTGVSLCSGANILELDTVMMVAQHCQCILGATGWSAAFSVERFREVARESFDREGPVGRVRRIGSCHRHFFAGPGLWGLGGAVGSVRNNDLTGSTCHRACVLTNEAPAHGF